MDSAFGIISVFFEPFSPWPKLWKEKANEKKIKSEKLPDLDFIPVVKIFISKVLVAIIVLSFQT
tara:strand:+ start:302 stop:493 length:192 start_codon:yes stop_codon:yes gene_type:complete